MTSRSFRGRNAWSAHGTGVAGPVAVQLGLVIAYVWALFELRQLPEAQ
jgi:hypothetical protein